MRPLAGALAACASGTQEASHLLDEAARGLSLAAQAWSTLEPHVLLSVPPQLLPRAGAVTARMLAAGHPPKHASTAIAALYAKRNTRSVARLWGVFDVERSGAIPAAAFDQAMTLLTDTVTLADMPAVRQLMGFVNAETASLNEFEATLRLLVPPDGSAPSHGFDDEVKLSDLLGSAANVQRLQTHQRHRLSRLAHRMHNFGYTAESMATLCRTLFLSKLHNKDLWRVWQLLAQGNTEKPIERERVAHLLALLSEHQTPEQIDELIDRIDENRSGDIEFEELATLLRAVNPQLSRPAHVDSIATESHPLLEQVLALLRGSEWRWELMKADPQQLDAAAHRARKLTAAARRLEDPADGVQSPKSWSHTLAMLRDVSKELLAAASEGGGARGDSLATYTDGSRAEVLARTGQALAHAAAMLAGHAHDSYEVHVALRTVRTIELLERVQASRAIVWRMPHGEEPTRGRPSCDERAA